MSDLRKEIAEAITGYDLSDNELVETALDRIGALAFADRLGGSLWRLKWANDHREFKRAYLLLAKRMSGARRPSSYLTTIARIVLEEWLYELCRTCAGRGHMVITGTPHSNGVCMACEGSAKHRVTEKERMTLFGASEAVYRKHARHFDQAHRLIITADERAWEEIGAQLERRSQKRLAHIRGRAKMYLVSPPVSSNNNTPDRDRSAPGTEQEQHAAESRRAGARPATVAPARPEFGGAT